MLPMPGQQALSPSAAPQPQVVADPSPAHPARSPVDGGDALLFAIACALWARHIGRRVWVWFFLGLLFQALAMLVLLIKRTPTPARATA
jgi:hypothetical protein